MNRDRMMHKARMAHDSEPYYIRDFRERLTNRARLFEGPSLGLTGLYFIQVGNDGPIKIGLARNVLVRLNQLQGGNPERLTVLCYSPALTGVESFLHREFAEYWITGEWFEPTRRVLAVAEEFFGIAEMCELLVADYGEVLHDDVLSMYLTSGSLPCGALALPKAAA